jgi:hypothetical protein
MCIDPIYYPKYGKRGDCFAFDSYTEFGLKQGEVFNQGSKHVYNYVQQNKELAKNTLKQQSMLHNFK